MIPISRPSLGPEEARLVAEVLASGWVTQGPRIGQLSLRYGVNDFGSTMMEENVVSTAGCVFTVPIEEIERLIEGVRELGRISRQ